MHDLSSLTQRIEALEQRDTYVVEFYPPLSAILERDSRGYPRIVRLWQSDNVLDTPLGDRTGEIPF